MVYAAERRPYHCSGSDSVVCHRTVWISEKEQISLCLFHGHENREILWTGFAWTQMVFVLSCVILGGEMNLVYLVFLLLLVPARFLLYQDNRLSSGGSGQCSAFVSGTLVGSVMRGFI